MKDKSPVANAIDGSRGGSSTPGSDNSRSNSSSDSVIGEIEGLKLIVVKTLISSSNIIHFNSS